MHRSIALTMSAAVLGLVTWTETAAAQPTAGRQTRLIVPFPAGGPTDIVARPFAQLLGDALKSVIVIDNRGGAGGSLGADAVAKSAPDGRTLLMGTVGTHAIHPSQPVNTLAELVALARRMPGKLNFGSAGAGTPGHLTGEMFKSAAGINLQHVPYRGSAPAVTDLLGGQLQLMFDPLQSVLSNVQGGRLRALAISSSKRSPILPDVPTIAESGYSGFETTAWLGVFAPAKLPADMAQSLGSEIERIVRSETFRGNLEPLGVLPTVLAGRAFAEFQTRELAKWGKAVRESGATAD